MFVLELSFIIIICSILSYITFAEGLLNLGGAISAFLVGIFIGILGGLLWIILLLIFLLSAFIATRYKFKYKKELGAQEGLKGERGPMNVIANGFVPICLALLHIPANSTNPLYIGLIPDRTAFFLFVVSVACAASDTMASEMGILSDKTYLITTLEKVRPGTNGGISLFGEMWAFMGSAYTLIISYILSNTVGENYISLSWLIFGIIIGFLSCQLDSLLGATLERKNIIGKSTVNMIAISISISLCGVIIWMIRF